MHLLLKTRSQTLNYINQMQTSRPHLCWRKTIRVPHDLISLCASLLRSQPRSCRQIPHSMCEIRSCAVSFIRQDPPPRPPTIIGPATTTCCSHDVTLQIRFVSPCFYFIIFLLLILLLLFLKTRISSLLARPRHSCVFSFSFQHVYITNVRKSRIIFKPQAS